MAATTPGVRKYVDADGNWRWGDELGVYVKDADGVWWVRPPAPGFSTGRIPNHDVVEHEDGTITVSPSILVIGGKGRTWHGYLERGIWREC